MQKISFIQFLMFSASVHAGFYSDVNLGNHFISTSKRLIYPLGEPPLTTSEFSSYYNGFHAQLALGYDIPIYSPWNLALEGNVDFFTGQAKSSVNNWFLTTTASAHEQFHYSWSFFVIPEYQLNDFAQLFIGPGVSISQYSLGSQNSPTGGYLGYTGQFTNWLTSVGFKTGISMSITEKLDLLFTYQLMSFTSVTKTGAETLSSSLVESRYTPLENTILVGLKYVFERTEKNVGN